MARGMITSRPRLRSETRSGMWHVQDRHAMESHWVTPSCAANGQSDRPKLKLVPFVRVTAGCNTAENLSAPLRNSFGQVAQPGKVFLDGKFAHLSETCAKQTWHRPEPPARPPCPCQRSIFSKGGSSCPPTISKIRRFFREDEQTTTGIPVRGPGQTWPAGRPRR